MIWVCTQYNTIFDLDLSDIVFVDIISIRFIWIRFPLDDGYLYILDYYLSYGRGERSDYIIKFEMSFSDIN